MSTSYILDPWSLMTVISVMSTGVPEDCMAGGGCDVHDIHHIHEILDDVYAGLEGFHIFLDAKLEPTSVRPDLQIIFSQARIGGRSNNADSAKSF
jgi:hypothetical protein